MGVWNATFAYFATSLVLGTPFRIGVHMHMDALFLLGVQLSY
jgi:hypothetical protein